MENLQKLLPFFQEQLTQWYQLTLEKPDYAAAIAVSVWLVLAILYSIRIGFLKRDIARLAKANAETQANLNAAQEQVQSLQQQLSEMSTEVQNAQAKAEAESDRASTVEQRLSASNQELAASLANLVECFELNVHNLPAANADNLLSEYQAVIGRVSERFQNEQQAKTQLQLSLHAESAKLAEKEMLISSLQHRLDSQTQQLAQMELAIEQYEAAQRQLQADREQQLAAALAKQQVEAAKLAELKKQEQEVKQAQPASVGAEPKIERPVAPEPPVAPLAKPVIETPSVQAKPEPSKDQAIKQEATSSSKTEAKPAPKKAKAAESGKSKGFFSRAMEKIAQMDQKLGTQTRVAPNSEPEAENVRVTAPQPEPVTAAAEQAKPAEPKKPSSSESMTAKMGGLFGGFKKSAPKPAEPEVAHAEEASAVEPAKTKPAEKPAKAEKKMTEQLTGLFGKLKSKK